MRTGFIAGTLVLALFAAPFAAGASPVAEKFYKDGVELAKNKQMGEAIAKFQNAVAFEPKTFKYHLNLAYAYDWANRLPEAQAAYEVAMKIGKNAIQAVKGHADVCRRLKLFSLAENSYRLALKKEPKDLDLIMGLGASMAGQDKLDEALSEYQKAMKLFPKEVQPAFKAANVLRKKGDLDGAIAHYRMAMERDPAYAKAEYGLGLVLRQKEDYPGAKKALESACKRGMKSSCKFYYKIKDK